MQAKKEFNYHIESLRGVAAILVAWHHTIIHKHYLDPNYLPTGIFSYNPPGHLSVLIFFILSGYVIGLTNKEPITRAGILPYLKKRLVRIYPIYALCLAFAFIIAPTHYGLSTIINHFTLTQVTFVQPIKEIDAVWSLNYEILFYLLFIPVSYFRINPLLLAIFCTGIGVVNTYFFPYLHTPLLTGYAFGFTFWLVGLALAQYMRRTKSHTSFATMVSMLFVILAIEKFNVLATLLRKVTTLAFGTRLDFPLSTPWEKNIITLQDYAFLPYATIAIIVFIGKDILFRKYLVAFLVLLPALTYYSFVRHHLYATDSAWILPAIFYAIGLIIYLLRGRFERISSVLIAKLVPTGSISYGIYLIHFPILCCFTQIQAFSGTPFTFATRFLGYMVLSISGAYLLEKKYQPLAKRLLT